MRLLVYGGNAFEERRRIGDWSEKITPKILQDRAGLSEARPSFGVGTSDNAPFLIYRRLHSYGGRSYPLVILLDPGIKLWEFYDWNAAHILLTLFGNNDSSGNALLETPENFYDEADLSRLIEKLETKAEIPATQIRSIADIETFKNYWFGAMALNSPLVQIADEKIILIRPTIAEMCKFFEDEIPSPMRCAKGWLMGGTRGLLSVFEVHYIIDDQAESMSTQTESAADEKLVKNGSRQSQSYSTVKKYSENGNASENLKDFFNLPFFLWNKKNNASTEKIFEEFDLLAHLYSDTKNSAVDLSGKTEKYFGGNKGLFDKELKELSEIHLDNKNKNEDWDDADAALAHRINYSPEKKSNLTERGWLKLLIKAIESATEIEKIRLHLVEELDSFNDNRSRSALLPRDWSTLADTILGRISKILKTPQSKDKFDPIRWEETFKSPEKEIYKQFYHPFRRKFEEFTQGDGAFYPLEYHKIYLIFGNDTGGEWLLSKKPEEFSRVIAGILQIITKKNLAEERLTTLAEEWLSELPQNPNFGSIYHQQRFEIFGKINFNGWEQLTKIFSYKELRENDINPISEFEQNMLADELQHWQEFNDDEKITPQLKHLTALLGEKRYKTILDIFEPIEPPLNKALKEIVVNWLGGWNILVKSGTHSVKEKSKIKLQNEVVRLINLKESKDWFEIVSEAKLSIKEICDDVSAKESFAQVGFEMLSGGDDDKVSDSERIKKFCGFFGYPIFSQAGIISKIYHCVPNSLIESDKAIAHAGEADEKFWNFYRRIDNDAGLLEIFEKGLTPSEFSVLTKKIDDYNEKLHADCLSEIERITNNLPPADFKVAIERVKQAFKEDVFVKASNTFFDKHRASNSDNARYIQMEKVLLPSLDDSKKKGYNEDEIFRYLFQDREKGRELREKLLKNKSDKESYIKKAVDRFLKEPLPIRGKIFFDSYLKKRIKTDDAPEINRNYFPDDPSRGDLPSHIFAALDPSSQIKLLESLCENEEIETELFGKLMWSEYNSAIDEADATLKKSRENRKNKAKTEIYESDEETSESPNFSPFQQAVLHFLGSIPDDSDSKAGNAKRYAAKIHQDNYKKSIDKNLALWGIEIKKKVDTELLKNDGEDKTPDENEGERKTFENIIRHIENRTIGNLFLPEFFEILNKRVNSERRINKAQ